MLFNAQQELELAQRLESTMLSQVAGLDSGFGASSFLEDPNTIRQIEIMARSNLPIGTVNLGPFMDAEQFAASLGSNSRNFMAAAGDAALPDAARIQAPYGIVQQLYRPTYLLDVIPHAVMEALYFTYVRESGSLDTGPAETAETALRPEDTGLDLSVSGTVRATTVTGWKKVAKQQLDDVAGLGTLLNQRLMYLVQRRIESEIVNGDGSGEDILGILNTTGVGSVSYDATKPASDLILAGLTQVRLANAQPSAILGSSLF